MQSNAQLFNKLLWGAGVSVLAPTDLKNLYTENAPPAAQVLGHMHYPIMGEGNSVLALGTHFGASYNSQSNGSITVNSTTANLPLCIEYHLGHNATLEATSRFGLYIGGGYNYYYARYSESGFGSTSGNIHGPIGTFGIKGKLLGRSYSLNTALTKSLAYKDYYLLTLGGAYHLKSSEVSGSGGGSGYRFKVPRTRNYGSRGRGFGFLRRRNYVPEY